jgi:hypothetical protein
MWRIFESFLRQAGIGHSRSSVLNPLQWALAISFCALLISAALHATPWLSIFFATIGGSLVIVFIWSYVFFTFKDPDALRSEKYSLVKTAIEKHLVGDSLTGLREVMEVFE